MLMMRSVFCQQHQRRFLFLVLLIPCPGTEFGVRTHANVFANFLDRDALLGRADFDHPFLQGEHMNILLPRAYFQTRGSQTSLIYTKTLCTHIFFLVPFFVLKHAPHVSPSLSRRDRSILSLSLSSLSLSWSRSWAWA